MKAVSMKVSVSYLSVLVPIALSSPKVQQTVSPVAHLIIENNTGMPASVRSAELSFQLILGHWPLLCSKKLNSSTCRHDRLSPSAIIASIHDHNVLVCA